MTHVPAHAPDFIDEIVDRELANYLQHLQAPPSTWQERKYWGLRGGWIMGMKAAGVAVYRQEGRDTIGRRMEQAMALGMGWMTLVGTEEGHAVRVWAWNRWLDAAGIRPPSEFIYPVLLDLAAIGYWLGRPDIGDKLVALNLQLPPHPKLHMPAFRAYTVGAWLSFASASPRSELIRDSRNIIAASPENRRCAQHLDTPLLDAMDALNRSNEHDFNDALKRVLAGHRHRAENGNCCMEYEDLLCPLGIGLVALAERAGIPVNVTSTYLAVTSADAPKTDYPGAPSRDHDWRTIKGATTAQLRELALSIQPDASRTLILSAVVGPITVFSLEIHAAFGNWGSNRAGCLYALNDELVLVTAHAEHDRGGGDAADVYVITKKGDILWRWRDTSIAYEHVAVRERDGRLQVRAQFSAGPREFDALTGAFTS